MDKPKNLTVLLLTTNTEQAFTKVPVNEADKSILLLNGEEEDSPNSEKKSTWSPIIRKIGENKDYVIGKDFRSPLPETSYNDFPVGVYDLTNTEHVDQMSTHINEITQKISSS